ncbi:MAG TPA: hypothetical protein VKZ88_06975, partial [Fibrobacteria bacterium]|nr:hypothetical protein [Fibrobacteria bacterium]
MTPPLDILGLTRTQLATHLGRLNTRSTREGRGVYHADALFRDLYRHARLAPDALPAFADNPALATAIHNAFSLTLPELAGRHGDGDTYKFLLKLD